MPKQETSKKNIEKAIDSRRIIGVSNFVERLIDYSKNEELFKKIIQVFHKKGFTLLTNGAKKK